MAKLGITQYSVLAHVHNDLRPKCLVFNDYQFDQFICKGFK